MKEHLFARICRTSGRFLLSVGAVLCAGSITIAFLPALLSKTATTSSTPQPVSHFYVPTTAEVATSNASSSPAQLITGIIISIVIFAILILAFSSYNTSIRKFIAKTAHSLNFSIHATEIILTTIVWTIANLIVIFNLPILTLITFPAMIINDLLFIFAWTSYGCPVYVI